MCHIDKTYTLAGSTFKVKLKRIAAPEKIGGDHFYCKYKYISGKKIDKLQIAVTETSGWRVVLRTDDELGVQVAITFPANLHFVIKVQTKDANGNKSEPVIKAIDKAKKPTKCKNGECTVGDLERRRAFFDKHGKPTKETKEKLLKKLQK